jgi:hypothetical protein
MSKAIIVAFRGAQPVDGHSFSAILSAAMAPNNLTPASPWWFHERGLLSFVFNPSAVVRTQKAGICLGRTTSSGDDLFQVGAARPDGTFALFRADENHLEVLTDYAGTRTIWYLLTNDLFVASTSQRMILAVVGNVDFNPLTLKWLLSSGTTGPGLSWDKRIKMIEPHSRVLLDRRAWTANYTLGSVSHFEPKDRPLQDHRIALEAAVQQSVQGLEIKGEQWALALSGGMDSRAILYFLQSSRELNLITWGKDGALRDKKGDAYIARRLALQCSLPHKYVAVQAGPVLFATTLERFLQAGEGRVDHFSGYLDGLELWANLAATGRGILRGYDAFGRKPPVQSDYQVRRANTLLIAADYLGSPIPPELAITEADFPEHLRQSPSEPLDDWRDRLWLEHRTPNVTAALDEIKASYVEVVNPLLCERVIEVVRALPASLRGDKTIFSSIVEPMFPSVPLATRYAIQDYDDVLADPVTIAFLRDVLEDDSGLLPTAFRAAICEQLNTFARVLSLRRRATIYVKANLPRPMENFVRRHIFPEPMNFKRLAARAVVAILMHRMLAKDAQLRPFQ